MAEAPAKQRPAPDIPGYELIDRLGQGGMAEVWLAQRSGSAQLVVIKRLLERHATSRTTQKRILREAQLGSLLRHENIARTVDAGITDEGLYIATEYLPGKDLEALSHTLARTQKLLPARVVARVMLDVLEGLHAAHEAKGPDGRSLNVVHRDLSPRNVQLAFDGRVALIDFGLAHASLGSFYTEPGTVLGTYRYMSPEQAIGEPVDRRSDLFSLGTSMYELFTGQWLFDAGGKQDILRAIVDARMPPPSEINPNLPQSLDEVILRAMAHHPADRHPTAAAMRSALEAAVPDWSRTPRAALAELLGQTFPHDAERAREQLSLAAHRVPNPPVKAAQPTLHEQAFAPTPRQDQESSSAPPQSGARSHGEHTQIVRPRGVRAGGRSNRRPERPLAPGIDPFDQEALYPRYDLVRSLGRGGMGRIYLAQRYGARDLSVLKVMHPDLVEQGGSLQLQRFAREGALLGRLRHPSIPALRALAVEGEGLPYMEMDHVAGANLSELAATQPGKKLPPAILLPLALQALDALHHAHDLLGEDGSPIGLVHRDISPNNLMATFDGVAKLIDFGVAHRRDETLTAVERPLLGKVMYCSPEQALQQPLDRRSDIYSFGVSFFELLSGRPVVDPELEPLPARQAIVHEALPNLRSLDPSWPIELQVILQKACAKLPSERFSDALEFRDALNAATQAFPRARTAEIASFVRRSVAAKYEDHVRLEEWAFAEDGADEGSFAPPSRKSSKRVRREFRIPWRHLLGGAAILSFGVILGMFAPWGRGDAVVFEPGPRVGTAGLEAKALDDAPVRPNPVPGHDRDVRQGAVPGDPSARAPSSPHVLGSESPTPSAHAPTLPRPARAERQRPDPRPTPRGRPRRQTEHRGPSPAASRPPRTLDARLCDKAEGVEARPAILEQLRAAAMATTHPAARSGMLNCVRSLERANLRYVGLWRRECERCLRAFSVAARESGP